MKICILLLSFLLLVQTSFSQTIKGKITNGIEVIPFANIYVKGNAVGTSADAYGQFTLNDVPEGKQEIVVSAIGYIKHKESFTVKAEINFYNPILEKSSYELDQVVVTGTMKESFIQASPVKVDVITQRFLEKQWWKK